LTTADVPAWVFFLPPLWIGGWITASILYRRNHGKPIVPKMPDGALYRERMASGANNSHWIGRIGGASGCLIVAVTSRELVITPYFPFNLMFLPEIYGLEVREPVSGIRAIEARRSFFRDTLIVHFSDGRSFRLFLRDPDAFRQALRRS
jgi:hypothetical protein